MSIDILSARIEVIGEERKDVALTVTLSGGRRKIVTPSGAKMLAGGGGLEISERDNRVSIESDAAAEHRITVVARVPRRAQAGSLDDQRGRDRRARHRRRSAAGEHQRPDHRDQHHRVGDRREREQSDYGRAGRRCGGRRDFAVLTERRHHADAAGERRAPSFISTARSGEIVSDFELDVKPSKPLIERNEGRGGVSVRMEDVIVATVNGGGPVIRVKTLNGAHQDRESRRLRKV